MKLKIGDKVKVIKSLDFPEMVGKVYEVTFVQSSNSTFCCRVQQPPKAWNPLMYEWEIEKVPLFEKGQQLQFGFMFQ